MKKFIFLFAILFAMQTAMMAQITDTTVVFNAHLLSTFNLIIQDGGVQEITFSDANDYNVGVTEPTGPNPGILSGITEIAIEATESWNLTIQCPDFGSGGGPTPGTGSILIDNLGVTITDEGDHGVGTGEVVHTQLVAQGIQNADLPLISVGANPNSGDITDNLFFLHWEMGTLQGTMHQPETMFDQMSAGLFTAGDYTTTAILTLTPAP